MDTIVGTASMVMEDSEVPLVLDTATRLVEVSVVTVVLAMAALATLDLVIVPRLIRIVIVVHPDMVATVVTPAIQPDTEVTLSLAVF